MANESVSKELKRSPNWSQEDKFALTEAVKERYSILFGKLDNIITNIQKARAWDEVLQAVNAVSAVARTLKQCKDQYKDMSDAALNAKEIRKTGGGSAEIVTFDPVSQNILDVMPQATITGIAGGIDTSDILDIVGKIPKIDKNPPIEPSTPIHQLVLVTPENKSYDDANNVKASAGTNSNQETKRPTTDYSTSKRQRVMSPTELLLEKQVNLFGEQLNVMKNIERLIGERNEIEKQKLQAMKEGLAIQKEKLMLGKYGILGTPYVPEFPMNTSVVGDDIE